VLRRCLILDPGAPPNRTVAAFAMAKSETAAIAATRFDIFRLRNGMDHPSAARSYGHGAARDMTDIRQIVPSGLARCRRGHALPRGLCL